MTVNIHKFATMKVLKNIHTYNNNCDNVNVQKFKYVCCVSFDILAGCI